MKILYVLPEEYAAQEFEQKFGKSPGIKIWNQVKQDGYLVIYNTGMGEDIDLQIKALEFDDVDPNFVGFIKSTLMDVEMIKHTNFYLIKE